MKTLILTILITLSGCGAGSGTEAEGNVAASCPVGSFISDTRYDTAMFTKTNYTSLDFNRCVATGYLFNCDSKNGVGVFQMHIETNQPGIGNPEQCAQVGDYYCEYSSDGAGKYLWICPTGPALNILKTGKVFEKN